MAPRTAIVLATVLLAVSTAAAQQPPSGSGWRLDLRADAALLQFREDLMVPLRHVGPAVGVRLGSGMLVITYRANGRVDVYHHPSLRMDDKHYGVVGKGLAHMVERLFENARFDVSSTGVDLYFSFDDVEGRPIEVTIREGGRRQTKPFGLLAPLGYSTAEPPFMPVFLLHDFYFTLPWLLRRTNPLATSLVLGPSGACGTCRPSSWRDCHRRSSRSRRSCCFR